VRGTRASYDGRAHAADTYVLAPIFSSIFLGLWQRHQRACDSGGSGSPMPLLPRPCPKLMALLPRPHPQSSAQLLRMAELSETVSLVDRRTAVKEPKG
jgi:hypothetical protein